MNEDGRVVYKITGDDSSYQKTISGTKTAAIAAAAAIGAAFAATTKILSSSVKMGMEYNAQVEQYEAAFTTMLGSSEKALDLVDKLRDTAATTPFELTDLANATQLLLNYGFTADEVVGKMQMLGDISQGNSEKMMRVATAYGQMSSAGKVTLEDVKQMIEAGFNPLQEIVESTGESMSSLYKRISDGTLSVDEITAAMERATSEGGKYYQSMLTQSKTLTGQLSTAKDNLNSFLGVFTSGLSDVAKNDILPALNRELEKLTESATSGKLKPSIDKLTDAFRDLAQKAIEYVSDLIPKLIDGFAWLVDNLDLIIGLVKTAVITFGTFKILTTVSKHVTSLVKEFQKATLQISLFTLENGKAALSNAAMVAQLSAGEIIVGVLTGKINILTAAQSLWNKAMSANPIGMVITGVTVLVGLIGGLTAVFSNSKTPMQEHLDALGEINKETEELIESQESASKSYEESKTEIEDNSVAAKRLVDRLKELQSASEKDAATKMETAEIVSQLNELVPDLGLAYDETTDSINMSTDAIYSYIDASKEKVLLQDAMERQNELWIEEAAILRELEKAQNEVADMYVQMTGDSSEAAREYAISVAEAQGAFDALTDAQLRNAEEQAYVSEEIEMHKETINGLNDALTATGDAQDRIIVGNYDISEALANTGISAEEAQEKFNTYADSAQNAFERIKDSVTLTADEMIANLESNQERIQNWTTNLGVLADRGLDEGLLQALRDLGPEAAATVQNLVNATDQQLQQLNDTYKRGGDVAVQALLTELGSPAVLNSGGQVVDEISSGMEANAAEAEEAAVVVVSSVADTMTNEINAQMPSVGQAMCQGLANGISKFQYLAINSAINLARSTITAAKRELNSHSPSKEFEKIGESEPQGLAKGIINETPMAERAVSLMAEKTIKIATPANIGSTLAQPSIAAFSRQSTPIQIQLTGSVDVDGFSLGKIMLDNLDDVASFALRG